MCGGWRRGKSTDLSCSYLSSFLISFVLVFRFCLRGAKRYFDLLYYFRGVAVGALLVRYHLWLASLLVR